MHRWLSTIHVGGLYMVIIVCLLLLVDQYRQIAMCRAENTATLSVLAKFHVHYLRSHNLSSDQYLDDLKVEQPQNGFIIDQYLDKIARYLASHE